FGNTRSVSWVASAGNEKRGFVGHVAQYGSFVPDTPGGIKLVPRSGGPLSLIDARVALSSNCTADPFTADGSNCPAAAVNAPFDTFATAGSPQRLFSQAITGGPNCVLFASCDLKVIIRDQVAQIIAKARQRHFFGIVVDRVGKRHSVTRIGRVPLGSHGRGTLHLRWNLRVNGKRLHPGRYRITLRALDKKGNVLGLS